TLGSRRAFRSRSIGAGSTCRSGGTTGHRALDRSVDGARHASAVSGRRLSSLFTYCTQALHLSEHAAYNRIETARAARRCPIILELVADSAVTLTTVRLLAPHLTPENHGEVLAGARHKSKRDIERLVASMHPQPDV